VGGREMMMMNFILLNLLLLFSLGHLSYALPNNKNEFRSNPYEILGVSSTATQKEIQRQYRSVCLQHHPDKKAKKERLDDEDHDDDHAFKEVQHAYSLIGNEESRRNHDLKQKYQQLYSNRNTQHNSFMNGNNGVFQNHVFPQSNVFGSSSTVYFTFGKDGGVSFKFSDGRGGRFGSRGSHTYHNNNFYNSGGTAVNQQRSRPHYVQKVSIPLEVLYAGGKNVEMNLKPNLFQRYKASYKGGLLAPIVMQAVFTVAMTWLRSQKVHWFLSIFLFGIMVHTNIPPAPQKTKYTANISPGWKGGTKLTFETSTEDVTFFIDEGKHERYTRCGNDLHTNYHVSKKRIRKGCTLKLDPLCDSESPIEIILAPRQIKEDGEIVTVTGRGWPKANCDKNSRGDLKVRICIMKGKKTKRS
jgi:DnaJ-class molecular chaperone